MTSYTNNPLDSKNSKGLKKAFFKNVKKLFTLIPSSYPKFQPKLSSFDLFSPIIYPFSDVNLSFSFLFLQKQRIANVRSKISKLTEEEKLEYMKLKAERKAAKVKLNSINDTIP